MKKRLLKAMPHVPLLELRPELREQDDAHSNTDSGVAADPVESNNEGIKEVNDGGIETRTTFRDLKENTDVEVRQG